MEDADGAPERTPMPALALEMTGCVGDPLEKAPLSSAAVGLALQDDQWAFETPGEGLSPGVYRYLRGSSARGRMEAGCECLPLRCAVLSRRRAGRQALRLRHRHAAAARVAG